MNNTDPTVDCLDERYWSYFLASSLITFFSGLILILSFRLASHFCTCNGGPKRGPEGAPMVRPGDTEASASDIVKVDMMTRLKWHCEELISGQTLVSLSCALSTGSLIIYLIDASQPDTQEETCKNWNDTPSQQVDLAFNLFFMAFFIIRFIASNDKLACWMDIHAFVDYFTIPPIFVGIYLNRQWLGLRFLRALRLMAFPDILQYLSLLRTSNAIRLAQICTIFLSVWLAAAGFVHLVEISGDPWNGFENSQNLTYWECVYFIVVTMSTVGYGDIYCITTIGRGFIVCFVLVALVCIY
ncbi:hypothetical protein CAPTEDRAFT_208428 [Capitella teleta]|uniref:BK channel n=1 Tax=Capitella teleta TaxID=283909 RepID=R7TTT7_CAPTE|nr:hypothetical protein CAPTEDRAFT_208428 [Capitella teleta]|eukprot:ELT97099.1 hypothetical protein CAPTEDRAFT_208428 [Capitella teleta]